MGTTGGECFVPSLCWFDPEDSGNNEGIGHQDDGEGAGEIEASWYEHGKLFDISVRTRKLNEWWVSTVEVVDDIGSTEGQAEGQDGL